MAVEIFANLSWAGGMAYVAGLAIKYAGPIVVDLAIAYSLFEETRRTKPPPRSKKGKKKKR